MNDKSLAQLISTIESQGFLWDIGCLGAIQWEARVWNWPYVKGRAYEYRTEDNQQCDVCALLEKAAIDAGVEF